MTTTRVRQALLCGIFAVLATGSGSAQSNKVHSWNIPADVIGSQNQLSFNQGARGVWFFMEALSTIHDPLTYRLLPAYTAPCANWEPVVGAGCWQSANLNASGDQHIPFVTVNFTDHPLNLTGILWPAGTLFLDPAPAQLAIVAWKSPMRGSIRVTGSFTQFNGTCGNGIAWSIDKGGNTLATGQIASGGGTQTFDLTNIQVTEDETLYFTSDSLGDYLCDEAPLNVTITARGSQNARLW